MQQVSISNPLNTYCAPEKRNYVKTHSPEAKKRRAGVKEANSVLGRRCFCRA
jgi:hypothetical protein